MVAVVAAVTATVETVNLPVVAPMATETVGVSVADFVDEVNVTATAPLPVPGVALRVTTPATAVPPATEDGVRVRPVTWNGLNVTVVVFVTPP